MRPNPFVVSGGEVRSFTIPLKRPFITALGRRSDTTNVETLVRLRGGAEGYGEASGSIVNARLKPEYLARLLRSELRRVVGKDVRYLARLADEAWDRCAAAPPAAAAVECALTEALCRATGLGLWERFGGAVDRIETDVTLSAGSSRGAAEAAAEARNRGFRLLKIKVGTGLRRDLDRVLAARIQAPGAGILLDGNQGMSLRSALELLEACLKRGVRVRLLEQPLPREDIKGMAELQRRSPVPLAADESVRTPEEALRILELGAAEILNVKVAKTGLRRSLEIVSLARAAGKRLMIGCMRETGRGLSAGVHLACGTGAFAFADLDSDLLLARDRPAGDFSRDGPWLRLRGRGGSPPGR